jgi:hypothetical protein
VVRARFPSTPVRAFSSDPRNYFFGGEYAFDAFSGCAGRLFS